MESYNGWANKETWLINIWFGDDMHDSAKATGYAIGESWCKDMVTEYLANSVKNVFTGFIGDVVGIFISSVDWREIADSVNEAAELSEESDDTDEEESGNDDAMDYLEYVLANK